jgi:serine/threonine-protein kinase PknG
MSRCVRWPCDGVMLPTGYCETCGLPPPPASSAHTDDSRGSRSSATATTTTVTVAGDPLVVLSPRPDRDPGSMVLSSSKEIPESRRFCPCCRNEVGRSYRGRPGQVEGKCNNCKTPYSFVPKLRPGQQLGHYKVVGPLAQGGVGWVYLAQDNNLDQYVVLKGLIAALDPHARESFIAERYYLTRLDHPNIVRALDFVSADDKDSGESTSYLVMNFVGGSSLRTVIEEAATGRQLPLQNVIQYGLEILKALRYLHQLGLLYCDLKPENVIHGGDRVRLIDLGAMRPVGGATWGAEGSQAPKNSIWGTRGYQVPADEIQQRGLTVDSDLYTVGRTLKALFEASEDHPGKALPGRPVPGSVDSFIQIVERATQPHSDARFRSAAEMMDQLAFVQREVVGRVEGRRVPMTSAQFAPPAGLLDSGLGAVPPLDRWTERPASRDSARGDLLVDGRPSPLLVAGRLPDPLPDPDDPATPVLAAVSASNPERLLGQLPKVDGSVEVELWRCRAHLALAARAGDRDGYDGARADLAAAVKLAPDAGRRNWRIAWHCGLVALATAIDDDGVIDDDRVAEAADLFKEVWQELPGEAAPKLALGFCAECRGHVADAERNYQAVWDADDTQTSAAFGLGRLRLARPDREGAVALLSEVPALSRHYDAARVAAVRVLAGRLGSGDAPGPAHLNEAADRLGELSLDGGVPGPVRDRLAAIVLQGALDWSLAGDAASSEFEWGLAALALFGSPVTGHGLREQLADTLRELARNASDADQHGTLIDLANAVRPWTRT